MSQKWAVPRFALSGVAETPAFACNCGDLRAGTKLAQPRGLGNRKMIPLKLLIIEDSEDDALLVIRSLRQAGYDVTATQVDTADGLRDALRASTFDVTIADYTMPTFNGTRALAIVREQGLDMPFIFVSGTIGEDVAVAAMKTGAHDYIVKGNLARLAPAVERELREATLRRERTRTNERVAYLAYHDPLTELAEPLAAAGSAAPGDSHDATRAQVAGAAGTGPRRLQGDQRRSADTMPAIACCSRWRHDCVARCVSRTRSRGWAATSSRCCCPAPTSTARCWPRERFCRTSISRSSWTTGRWSRTCSIGIAEFPGPCAQPATSS